MFVAVVTAVFNIPVGAFAAVLFAMGSSSPFGNANGIASLNPSPFHVLLICLYNVVDAIAVHVCSFIATTLFFVGAVTCCKFLPNFVVSATYFSPNSSCGSACSLLRITSMSIAVSRKNIGISCFFIVAGSTNLSFCFKFHCDGQLVVTFFI